MRYGTVSAIEHMVVTVVIHPPLVPKSEMDLGQATRKPQ